MFQIFRFERIFSLQCENPREIRVNQPIFVNCFPLLPDLKLNFAYFHLLRVFWGAFFASGVKEEVQIIT